MLVVDDVLYTGHSLLRVVEYLARKQPAAIRVACLVDRVTTRLPVHADVVGARLASPRQTSSSAMCRRMSPISG